MCKPGSGRCGHRPLRSVYRQDFVGGDAHIAPRPLQGARKNGRGRTPPLRKGCKRCGEVKNPPVTASPCQPPLGKGPRGRGMRIATASLRTGLAMTWFLQEVRWAGRCRYRPLRRFDKKVPVKNPPVTASPCQPPLGKGAKGTGDADCHSQFANWPRNDMVFARSRCKAGGRTGSFAPTGSFWLYLHRKIYISKAKEEDS